jgi:hypothetical protein
MGVGTLQLCRKQCRTSHNNGHVICAYAQQRRQTTLVIWTSGSYKAALNLGPGNAPLRSQRSTVLSNGAT